jgi:hypothetical protein
MQNPTGMHFYPRGSKRARSHGPTDAVGRVACVQIPHLRAAQPELVDSLERTLGGGGGGGPTGGGGGGSAAEAAMQQAAQVWLHRIFERPIETRPNLFDTVTGPGPLN